MKKGNFKKSKKKYVITRNYTELGEALKEGRVKAGMTQLEVSKALKYSSAQFISNFERGISPPPVRRMADLIPMYNLEEKEILNLLMVGRRREVEKGLSHGRRQ